MKVKMISRDEIAMTRERSTDMPKQHRNVKLRKHQEATEMKRAVNAAKLARMFAKPFVGQLEGHMDTVTAMGASPRSLDTFVTGAADGEVKVWSLARRQALWSVPLAHTGSVRGLVVAPNGESYYTCSTDRTIKQWRLAMGNMWAENVDAPVEQWAAEYALTALDGHRSRHLLASGSRQIDVWDTTRALPVNTMGYSDDTVLAVKFNPVETELLAATASDRSLSLFDLRTDSPIRKIVLAHSLNDLAWNPMEAFSVVVASDDHNLYAFDVRKLTSAVSIYKDHVSAVMSVAFSPTGKAFVSGSYDQTIRTWSTKSGHSIDCYHTNRMQRVFQVEYTSDARYVLSSSDDASVRVWKARASEKLGALAPRQKVRQNYEQKLLKRYGDVPAVSKIYKRRHEPTAIRRARNLRHIMRASEIRKEERRRATARDEVERVPVRKSTVKEVLQ